jgi:gamma-butyrobetaine dioxygenase
MGAGTTTFPLGPFVDVSLERVANEELPNGKSLRVTTADGPSGGTVLLAEWLRDQCQCTTCRIAQTDERRQTPWSRPAAIVETATVEGGELTVAWEDGHRSTYNEQWATSVNTSLRRGGHDVNLWRAGHELFRCNHDEVLHNPDVRLAALEAFAQDGAVVVTGSPTEPGSVIPFVKGMNLTLLDSALGFIFDVRLDPTGYNVAYTSEALPLHNDNAQQAHPPSGQVLAMLVNDASGGETLVCDGWSVVEQLRQRDPAIIDVLASVDVGFRQYSTEADGFHRSPLVRLDNSGNVTHLRFSNQLMQPLEFDHPRLAEWYDAYRLLGQHIHDASNKVSFRLNAGDMLMVNGYRILHARTAFEASGPRHLQDVYFCTQDVFDQLSRLKGETVNAMVMS